MNQDYRIPKAVEATPPNPVVERYIPLIIKDVISITPFIIIYDNLI
jgi:hypothetical protein